MTPPYWFYQHGIVQNSPEPSRLLMFDLKEDCAGFSLCCAGSFTSFKTVCDGFSMSVQPNYATIYL